MQAVVLIGGLGTRLRELYPDRPKALVPVLGRPYLDRLIEWLSKQGIADVHLACGFKANDVETWLRSTALVETGHAPSLRGVRITLSVEPTPLGTGGGLKFVEPHIKGDPFVVFNGDSFLPFMDLADMLAAHSNQVTIAVTRIESSGRYGTVEFDSQNQLTAFLEKIDRKSGWVNGGVYTMEREVLKRIPPGKNVSLETDVFPDLAFEKKITAFQVPPPLLDIGTPAGLAETEKFFQSLEK